MPISSETKELVIGIASCLGAVMLMAWGCAGNGPSHASVMWPDGQQAMVLRDCYGESCLKEAALACPHGYTFVGKPPKDGIPNAWEPATALRCNVDRLRVNQSGVEK